MELKTEFRIYKDVYLQVGNYLEDDSIAVKVWNQQDGSIATLTVCLCDKGLKYGESYIDTNNCPWAVNFIEKEGLGKQTGQIGHSGYCSYPVVKFNMTKLRVMEEENGKKEN